MRKSYKVIIAGSRSFYDYNLLNDTLNEILPDPKFNDVEIISGHARGADTLGETYAINHGYNIKTYIPDWSLGKRAGLVRNQEMAKYCIEHGSVRMLIAFWDGKSSGTEHMINTAKLLHFDLVKVIYF